METTPLDPPAMLFIRHGMWLVSKFRSHCGACGEVLLKKERVWFMRGNGCLCSECKEAFIPSRKKEEKQS